MKGKLNELRREEPDPGAKGPTAKPSTTPSAKASGKTDAAEKKGRLVMHPLTSLAEKAGALGQDASIPSIITYGYCGIHASAADHISREDALGATIVWKVGNPPERQYVFRDLTDRELQRIPIIPNKGRDEEDDVKKNNKDETNEEESDD